MNRSWIILLVGVLGLFQGSNVMTAEIGFVEDFALAADRTVPLAQLIPGTEDYYYYHCLHYQSQQQYDKVESLLTDWIERHNVTPRVREIQNRQALLTYGGSAEKTLDYLQKQLGLRFDHQRDTVNRAAELPTAFDPALIARERLTRLALERHRDNLDGFEDSALEWLIGQDLDAGRQRVLLQRLQRPDLTRLARFVVEDLNAPNSPGFGAFPIHHQLLKDQLDELLQLKPNLRNEVNFVHTYLTKLRPNPDVDWQNDPEKQQAYLERLWSFVSTLAPTHNSLKAHVLYHRLTLDMSRGQYDKSRFLDYLQLPRSAPYVNPRYLTQPENRNFAANLGEDFRSLTLLPPVGEDQSLVRQYLQHFFVDASDYKEFEPYVNDVYLKELFAETKIVNGLGDPNQWYAMLPPANYQQLKERVDLDFAPSNPRLFAADQSVNLDVDVKNVSTLIVKVYRINALNYYQDQARQVSTNINLDGLVANEEQTYQYDEPPLRRVRRHFEFPSLSEPGLYVIDFIGNGKNSRVLVQKGKLHHVVRTTPAGLAFTVLDEKNQPLKNASLWLGGQTFSAHSSGEIVVPFSTQPGQQPVILIHGATVTLDSFHHPAEAYQLEAGIYADRESLLANRVTNILLRPGLTLNGTPVSLKLLENVRLEITSTDLDDVSTTEVVSTLSLQDDQDVVHALRVPPRLSSIQFVLRAQVKSLSENKLIDVQASQSYTINQIEKSFATEDLHLRLDDQGYSLDVLGKSGEPKANRPVQITVKHRDFREPVVVTLRSDAAGRIDLGDLHEIVTLSVKGPEGTEHAWPLRPDRHSYPQSIHGLAGEVVELPYIFAPQEPDRDTLSLLELRDGTFVADRFSALKVERGRLLLQNLPPGDYSLVLKPLDRQILVRITEGDVAAGYALGEKRQLELRGSESLYIQSIAVDPDQLTIALGNVSPTARVHIFATEFEPAFDAFDQLARVRDAEPVWSTRVPAISLYVEGRLIGDEFRYILDRKYAQKFPGNMLPRPELLLNPWAIRDTATGQEELAEGTELPAAAADLAGERAQAEGEGRVAGAPTDFANLDFLSRASAIQLNAKPDEQGRIRIDRSKLEGKSYIRVLAVDAFATSSRTVLLPPVEAKSLDLRLLRGLDPQQSFSQQKQITLINKGETFAVDDIRTAKFELYDSLSKVYRLYETLQPHPHLDEFRFVLRWDQISDVEQRELYSKYACHELSFYLSRKDPEFFETVIQPYLRNKLHKTFMDEYLLGDDLKSYLDPWKYEQLNVVERILLAQRIEGEGPRTAEHLTNAWNLIPPDLDRFNLLFDTALKGQSMAVQDELGLVERLAEVEAAPQADYALPPAPGGAMGGMGGAADRRSLGRAVDSARGSRPTRQRFAGADVARDGAMEAESLADEAPTIRYDQLSRSAARKMRENYFADDLALRGEVADKAFFRQLDQTKEWVENNYYQLPIEQQDADLVGINAFWLDFARHREEGPFFSTNLAEASRNFTEIMLALAVLDLPVESPKHEVTFGDNSAQIIAGGPCIVFHQQIRPTQSREETSSVLVSENFFRHGDRHQMVGNQQVDKFVTEEFLVQAVYGGQIVVTNPTSAPVKLDVLIQVPIGAIPVNNGQYTRNVHLQLEPYRTESLEYYFYFPAPGQYAHFPVHVAKGDVLLASAEGMEFHVVEELTQIDRESWPYVSQSGTNDDVLQYLRTQNLQAIQLDRIAFRMGDRDFFRQAIEILTQRHAYDHTLWSYAIKHNEPQAIEEYLRHADDFVQQCGRLLNSPLLVINPVERKMYEHMEYHPLVNPRAHQIGARRQILNDRFHAQYHRWLDVLSFVPKLNDQDRLATVYYLLLQDRFAEAIDHFQQIDRSAVQTQLQYDYCAAYVEMTLGKTAAARAIANQYENHPVDRWREAFALVRTQLDEIEGQDVSVVNAEDRNQVQDELAAKQPSFDFKIEAKDIQLEYRNLEAVRINYYLMDIELLFSRNPFVQRYSGQFSYIQPNLTQTIPLPAAQGSQTLPLPERLHNQNVLIEIEGAGNRRSQPYYSNALAVQVIENYGQLRVTDVKDGKPLSTVYVKVYAQLDNGQVQFFKDGYTDLRGRFDYSSLSTNLLDHVSKFAILVLSEEHGAVVREANPPKR